MGVSEALHITQANISRQALHRRVKRARDKVREKEVAEQAATYTVNLAGEALPPLYIFDSKCQNDDNFSIDLRACDGLPEVTGKYGLDKLTCIASYVAVRKKGGTDAPLWTDFNETVLQPLYPRMAKTVKRCPITQKMLEGPLVTKTDSGPGRLAKSLASLQFRESAPTSAANSFFWACQMVHRPLKRWIRAFPNIRRSARKVHFV